MHGSVMGTDRFSEAGGAARAGAGDWTQGTDWRDCPKPVCHRWTKGAFLSLGGGGRIGEPGH